MFKRETLGKLLKFAVTGGLGTVTNLLLFFFLADKGKMNEQLSSIICFVLAGTQNYIINFYWTFQQRKEDKCLSVMGWARFIVSSLAGFAVNISVLTVLTRLFAWPLLVIPQGIGILCGMGINFVFSSKFVYSNKKQESEHEAEHKQ